MIYNGDKVEYQFMENKKARIKVYHLGLYRNIHDVKVPKSNCINYPTSQCKTYHDCDDAFVYEQFKVPSRSVAPVWVQKYSCLNCTDGEYIRPNIDENVLGKD